MTIDVRSVVVPDFLYGTAWKEEATAACVTRALAAGFRGLDTSLRLNKPELRVAIDRETTPLAIGLPGLSFLSTSTSTTSFISRPAA